MAKRTFVDGDEDHTDGGFRNIADHIYEFCWPDAVIVPDETTIIRYTYDGRSEYDTISARVPVGGSSVVISADIEETPTALAFTIRQEADYSDDANMDDIGPIRVDTSIDITAATSLAFGARRKISLKTYEDDVTFTGTARYVAVSGQPTQYDLYITITSASTDDAIAKAGDYGWDIEALFSGGKIRPVISGELTLKRSMIAHASP